MTPRSALPTGSVCNRQRTGRDRHRALSAAVPGPAPQSPVRSPGRAAPSRVRCQGRCRCQAPLSSVRTGGEVPHLLPELLPNLCRTYHRCALSCMYCHWTATVCRSSRRGGRGHAATSQPTGAIEAVMTVIHPQPNDSNFNSLLLPSCTRNGGFIHSTKPPTKLWLLL